MALLPNSIEGLMGLCEKQLSSLISFKGLELSDGSSPFKWEWFSKPLECPPNEGYNPEPVVGTMSPLEGNLCPSKAGRK
jgi:hypothetical protein